MIDKKEIEQIKKLKGKVRGATLKTDIEYVANKYGKQGVEKLKKELKKTGENIDYNKIKNINWYPVSWRILSLVVINKTFNMTDKDMEDMGYSAPSNSFLVKIILRYFISLEKTFKECSKYWEKHWSVGRLYSKDINLEKKCLVLQLQDIDVHPILYNFLKGYFRAIAELMIKVKKIKVTIKKCDLGNKKSCDEFILKW